MSFLIGKHWIHLMNQCGIFFKMSTEDKYSASLSFFLSSCSKHVETSCRNSFKNWNIEFLMPNFFYIFYFLGAKLLYNTLSPFVRPSLALLKISFDCNWCAYAKQTFSHGDLFLFTILPLFSHYCLKFDISLKIVLLNSFWIYFLIIGKRFASVGCMLSI